MPQPRHLDNYLLCLRTAEAVGAVGCVEKDCLSGTTTRAGLAGQVQSNQCGFPQLWLGFKMFWGRLQTKYSHSQPNPHIQGLKWIVCLVLGRSLISTSRWNNHCHFCIKWYLPAAAMACVCSGEKCIQYFFPIKQSNTTMPCVNRLIQCLWYEILLNG